MSIESLAELVRETIRDQFPTAAISDVIVRPGVDDDGDKILRIFVLLNNATQGLDPDALIGLARHLKSRLADVNREEFPVVSFFSKADAKKLKLEAA